MAGAGCQLQVSDRKPWLPVWLPSTRWLSLHRTHDFHRSPLCSALPCALMSWYMQHIISPGLYCVFCPGSPQHINGACVYISVVLDLWKKGHLFEAQYTVHIWRSLCLGYSSLSAASGHWWEPGLARLRGVLLLLQDDVHAQGAVLDHDLLQQPEGIHGSRRPRPLPRDRTEGTRGARERHGVFAIIIIIIIIIIIMVITSAQHRHVWRSILWFSF